MEQKFALWFAMNSRDRCRLWNSLTFQFKYFQSAAQWSTTGGGPENLVVMERADLKQMCEQIQSKTLKTKRKVFTADVMRSVWEQLLAFAGEQDAASAPINSSEWKAEFGRSPHLKTPKDKRGAQPLSEQEIQNARLAQVNHFSF